MAGNSTLTSADMVMSGKPSVRLHHPPGGTSSGIFGSYEEPRRKPATTASPTTTAPVPSPTYTPPKVDNSQPSVSNASQGEATYSLLSDKAILRHLEKGTVVIHPFTRDNLSTSSYDVTLGPYYYRETVPEPGQGIYNPYSEPMVHKVWGSHREAETAKSWSERNGIALDNISSDDRVIWIGPGETILAHTNEFVGGKVSVTAMMKARSSLGRNFIEVCKCAGWGDVGYVNRWTMGINRFYLLSFIILNYYYLIIRNYK